MMLELQPCMIDLSRSLQMLQAFWLALLMHA